MKILIWIGSFIFCSLVNSIFDALLRPFGLQVGWLLRFLITVVVASFLARYLCIKWDRHKIKTKATKEGVSENELVQREIPSSLRSLCEDFRGNKVALESLLDNSVNNGTISKAEAALLLEEYSNN